jgi:hypothetical protein
MVKFRITQTFDGYYLYYKIDYGSHVTGYVLYHENDTDVWDTLEECKEAAQRCAYNIFQEYGMLIEEFEI